MITQTWMEGLRERLDRSHLKRTVKEWRIRREGTGFGSKQLPRLGFRTWSKRSTELTPKSATGALWAIPQFFSGFWWGHPMPRSLRAYLKKEVAGSDFVIHYYIAGGFSGATDFRLRGDGSYDLCSRVTKERQPKSYSGQIATSQVEQIVQKMLETRIWQVRHLYPTPALDDVGAKIAVEVGEQKSEVMLWVSEIREIPPFVIVQRELLSLIHQISEGEVIEYGRGTFDLFLEETEPQTRLAQLKIFQSKAKSQVLSLVKGLLPMQL